MAGLIGMQIVALLASLWLALAPQPPGIALNLETKECAGFRAGADEYMSKAVPEGWVTYFAEGYGPIETEVGTCTYAPSDGHGAAENCCQELGYTYVGDDVGTPRPSPLLYLGAGFFLLQVCGTCLVVFLVVALVFGVGLLLLRWILRTRQRAQVDSEPQAGPGDAERG